MESNNNTTAQVLKHLGIQTLNPMQLAAAEAYHTKNDVVLLSPTGSGKTLGFLLPLVPSLKADLANVQVLVLAPSRELALQIEEVFKSMKTGLKVNCCYGGHSVKIEINNLSHPPALLIGTPGRIDDLIKRGVLDLKKVHTLVLDEFDKSLELGFQEEIGYIMSRLPQLKQRFLTSATELRVLPEFMVLKDPQSLNFLKNDEPPARLEVKQITTTDKDKLKALLRLIAKVGKGSMLVFLNQRDSVEQVSRYLSREGIAVGFYHGGLEQFDRERALLKFRNGSTQVLVTTDLAARGLDIPEVRSVIHFELPLREEEFIHRNGRTARMHASGVAYLLISETDDLPAYVDIYPEEDLPSQWNAPKLPEWETVFIGKGKKDKVNKVDIVGFLCQKGGLEKHDIGLIEVKDSCAYVAVKRNQVFEVLKKVRDEKLKNIKMKIEIAR